jgi:hypothetical protein
MILIILYYIFYWVARFFVLGGEGHEKVSAKEALGWSEKGLQKFHVELDDFMTKKFGRDIGILNEATKGSNRTIQQLKQETMMLEYQAELEAVTYPIRTKIAHEKIIGTLMEGVRESTSPISKKITTTIKAELTREQVESVCTGTRACVHTSD